MQSDDSRTENREQRGVNFAAGAIRQLERRIARLEAAMRELTIDRRSDAVIHRETNDADAGS
jgi:hypothetical protein